MSVKGFIQKKYSSTTNWENSYFGGYYRVIQDYPWVKIDNDIEFTHAEMPRERVSYYEGEKILKMFMSKVKTHGLNAQLARRAKKISKTKKGWFGGAFGSVNTEYLEITKTAKEFCLERILSKETELAPLFKHYSKFIIDSSITLQLPKKDNQDGQGGDGDKDKKDKKDSGSGSSSPQDSNNKDQGNAEGSDEKKKDPGPTAEEMQTLVQALERTIENEPYVWSSLSGNTSKPTYHIVAQQNPCEYSTNEVKHADSLLKLLDISFDPKSAPVKSLRAGKLDLSKIAEVPAGNTSIYHREVEEQETRPFSVCILCDESGSMTDNEKYIRQSKIVKSLYYAFSQILPQEKIYVYGHSGHSAPHIFIYQDPHNLNFETTCMEMLDGRSRGNNDSKEHRFNNNYDGPVIEAIHQRVRGFTKDRIIFIVLSDGAPHGVGYGGSSDIQKMKQIIEKCKRDDFVTVGVGIRHFIKSGLYNYQTVVTDMSLLAPQVSQLLNRVVKTEFQ